MRFNRTRHRVLHHLYLKFKSDFDSTDLTGQKKTINADKAGLTFAQIDNLLKNKKKDRELILSELYKNKEIHFFDLKVGKGCMIDEDYGVSAYSNKKYLNENNKIFRNFILFILPIIGLVVAITNLYLQFDSFKETKNIEIETLNSKVEIMESSIEKLKNNTNPQIAD